MRQQGITGILVLIVALLGAALFLPFPYYQKDDVYCESYPPQLCAKKGWNFGKPLWKQILKTQETTDSSSVLTQQPTLDPTADWKTYENKKYGFTFQYLEKFLIDETDFSTIRELHPKNKTEFMIAVTSDPDLKNKLLLGKDKSVLNISVSVWKTNKETVDKALEEYHAFYGGDLPAGTDRQLNGVNWLSINYTNNSSVPISEHALLRQGRLFVVGISPADSQLRDVADKILSTFKFTN